MALASKFLISAHIVDNTVGIDSSDGQEIKIFRRMMRMAATRLDLPYSQENVVELKRSILSKRFTIEYPSTSWINNFFQDDVAEQNSTYLSLSQVLKVDAWPS